MSKAITIFFFLCLSANSLAASSWFSQKSNEQDYFISNKEEGVWVLRHYRVKPRQLQDFVEQRIFEEPWQLESYIERLKASYPGLSEQSKKPHFFYVNTEVKSQVMWTATEEWDVEWENKYNEWVGREFSKRFFVDHNIATDCADAAMLLRWIFAREHKLPMGATLPGTGVLLTHESMKSSWARLPTDPLWYKDQRFRAILNYIANNTYTHSLFEDTYPVKITTSSLTPGVIYLLLSGESGHTRLISKVDYSLQAAIPITFYWSTLPKEVRELYEEPFIGFRAPQKDEGGFRRVRWLEKRSGVWRLRNRSEHPDYSLEQYTDFNDKDFVLSIYEKLVPGYDPSKPFQAAIEEAVSYIELRVDVVEKGFQFCQANDCSPGTLNWENWSTPSRDKRILEKIETVDNLVDALDGLIDPSLWEKRKKTQTYVINGVSLKLSDIEFLWQSHLYSSDPRVSQERRWALSKQAVIENVEDFLNKMMTERGRLVQGGSRSTCASGCDVHSAEYEKWQSFELDGQIKGALNGYRSYCRFFKQRLGCQNPVQLNYSKVKVGKDFLTIDEAAQQALFFVSDPRAEGERRWGKHNASMNWVAIPPTASDWIFPFPDKLGLVSLGDGNYFNLNSQNTVKFSEFCELRDFPEGKRHFCFDIDEDAESENSFLKYVVFEVDKSFTEHQLQFHNFGSIQWALFGSDTVVLQDDDTSTLNVYKLLSTGELSLVLSKKGQLLSYLKNDRLILFADDSDSRVLLSIEESGIREVVVKSEDVTFRGGDLVSRQKDWVIANGYVENSNGEVSHLSLFISLKTGESRLIDKVGFFVIKSIPEFEVFLMTDGQYSSGRLYQGHSPSQLMLLRNLKNELPMLNSSENYLYLNYPSLGRIERFDNGQFESFAPSLGEIPILSLGDIIYLFVQPSASMSLTNWDRTFAINSAKNSSLEVCHGDFGQDCKSTEKKYFWHVTNRESSTSNFEVWGTLFDLSDTKMQKPIMSLWDKFSDNENFVFSSESFEASKGGGTVVKPDKDTFVWIE